MKISIKKYRIPTKVSVSEIYTFFAIALLMTRYKMNISPLIHIFKYNEKRFYFILKILNIYDNQPAGQTI